MGQTIAQRQLKVLERCDAAKARTLEQLADDLKKHADVANWHAEQLPRRFSNTDEERRHLGAIIGNSMSALDLARAIQIRL